MADGYCWLAERIIAEGHWILYAVDDDASPGVTLSFDPNEAKRFPSKERCERWIQLVGAKDLVAREHGFAG